MDELPYDQENRDGYWFYWVSTDDCKWLLLMQHYTSILGLTDAINITWGVMYVKVTCICM